MLENCYTTNKLLSKEETIVAILRDAEDQWEFVGNEPNKEEEIVVVSLDQVYEAYPELKAICEQLELSQCAVWDNVDNEWLIDDYDEEEEYDEDEFEEEEDAS
jgi:type IV secretory pathway VirB4 component